MASFKKELVSGTVYIAIAKYSGVLSGIVISAILARLLTPADFGIISIATVFIVFFSVLSNVGIGPAIIQRKDLSDDDLDSLFSFTFYLGVSFALFFFILAWPISFFYHQPLLVPVCHWLSLLVLCSCIQTVSLNLLYRDKEFKFVAFMSLVVSVLCGTLAIIAAYSGWGVYALVTSQVVSNCITCLIYLIKRPRKMKFHPDVTPLKSIFSYSSFNFLASIMNYFILNLDKLLIGKFIGPVGLGHYEKSYRLMFMPIQNITFVVEPVLHPLFSEIQNNYQEIADKYLSLLEKLGFISFPISVFCYFSSTELILLFFGNQWVPAIDPFKIMALSIGLQMLSMTLGAMFNATNSTKLSFYSALLTASIMMLTYTSAIIIWGTILSVAYAFLITSVLTALIALWMFFHHIHCPFVKFFTKMTKPILSAMLVAFALLSLDAIAKDFNMIIILIAKSIVLALILLVLGKILYGINPIKLFSTISHE